MDGARGQGEVTTAGDCSLVMIKHTATKRACIMEELSVVGNYRENNENEGNGGSTKGKAHGAGVIGRLEGYWAIG